jgi:hypothetical protein
MQKPFVPRKQRTPAEDHLDTLKSALMMYTLSLQPGSDVEIFYEKHNRFYEATVKAAGRGGGFRYAFKNRHTQQGFVRFKDCLGTWRPSTTNQKHLTPSALLLIYDAMHS